MTQVVLYARVSTEHQADGVSLDAQVAKLSAYATALDLAIVDTVSEVGSAKSLARPGLERALGLLKAGKAQAIAVTKLDRLTRSVSDLGTLIREYFATDYSLLSVGDSVDTRSAAGRLVLHILGSVSQWEREAIGERTKSAMSHLRNQGVSMGRAPLGMRYGDADEHGRKQLIIDEGENIIVMRIRELRASGLSYARIAHTLQSEGVPTKRGGKWDIKTVQRIMSRAA